MNRNQAICVALYHLVKRFGCEELQNRKDSCLVEMVCCNGKFIFTFTDETVPAFFFLVRIDCASGAVTTIDRRDDDQAK